MVRWEPGAGERLQAAAMDLYLSQGFEKTTVAEIAAAVGLTERSFFRHFADKREVLFAGQDLFRKSFLDGADSAPDSAGPLEVVSAVVSSIASFFPDERRERSQRRQLVIDANPSLKERELLKMADLAESLTGALRARGVGDPTAALAAHSGVTVFNVAFSQWVTPGEARSFHEIQARTMEELVAVITTAQPAGRAPLG